MKSWTESELGILRRCWEQHGRTVEQIAATLGKPVGAVRSRIKTLHLRRSAEQKGLWTVAQETRLREAYGIVPLRRLAAELGRAYNACKQKAIKLGLESGRYYTPEEMSTVRELYDTHTAAEIAERLWGTAQAAKAVFRMAFRLGLRKWPSWEPEVIERVRALHAEGLCDHDILHRMGDVFAAGVKGHHQVKHVRKDRLKLPANPDRGKGRRATDRQCATLGLANVTELRTRAFSQYALAHGWPADTQPRSVQILDALYALGPRTRRQLAVDIDLACARRGDFGAVALNKGFAANREGGSYFAVLIRAGLVCVIGSVPHPDAPPQGRGSGTNLDLYSLTPHALKLKGDFLEQQQRQSDQADAG